MMERRGLGKGFSAILSDQNDISIVRDISIDRVFPNPHQPRKRFRPLALSELSLSIKLHGVIQPIIVRQVRDDHYEIVAGERRLRASKLAGLKEIPAIIRNADALAMLEVALIENLQRDDLNAVEAARAYKKLIEDFGLTHEQVASRIGKTRSAITNALRLLNLPPHVLELLESGEISEGHAKALLGLRDTNMLEPLVNEIASTAMNVRDTEKRVRNLTKGTTTPRTSHRLDNVSELQHDPYRHECERKLSDFFGTKVNIIFDPRGGGKLAIDFYSDDDLTRILDLLGMF